MVILSPEQERILENLARTKAQYDREIHVFEEQLAEMRAQKKQPIRAGVIQAREAGIPDRQIHIKGLGMAQLNQMINFLRTPAAKRALIRDFEDDLYGVGRVDVAPVSANWEWRGIDKGGKMWEATSPDGTKYGINLLTAGKISVIKPNKDKPGQYAEWTPELIHAAKAFNEKWLTMEDYEASSHVDEDEEDED